MKLYKGVEVDLGPEGLLTVERHHLEGNEHLVYACLNGKQLVV